MSPHPSCGPGHTGLPGPPWGDSGSTVSDPYKEVCPLNQPSKSWRRGGVGAVRNPPPFPPERPPPRALCLGPLPPLCVLTSAPPWGPRRAQLPSDWLTPGREPALASIFPLPPTSRTQKRREDLSGIRRIQASPKEAEVPWAMCRGRNVSHSHFFFNLLQNLTKHWPQLVPTCSPQKLPPSPSQSLWVQPRIPSARKPLS